MTNDDERKPEGAPERAKPMTIPDLKLRRTWNDGGQPREDFEVIDARGERVGRMSARMR
jgi:hypothetical protein